MRIEGNWTCTVYREGEKPLTVPATVPGCVHTDLKRAGVIGDYFYRDNAESVRWIEDCDVTYTGDFTVDAVETGAFLRFEGLDCYCTVYLNGVKLGEADDMFIPHEFPAEHALRVGGNRLEVRFRSPVREVAGKPARYAAFTGERLYTRRIQCTYGWDWVARFVTMGICGGITLQSVRPDSLDTVYVYTKSVTPYAACIGLSATFQNLTDEGFATFTVTDPDGRAVFEETRALFEERVTMTADIRDPRLWYPAGYGEQPLYRLTVTAGEQETVTPFGIRTVDILELRDESGTAYRRTAEKLQTAPHLQQNDRNAVTSGFWVLVNGVRIFCQGGNWVPCDPFPSEESDERIRRLVRSAAECGCTMLRVWGGGEFPRDAFFEECDRLGILVTQDFLMACGSYPEEDADFREKLQKEAKAAALRLRNHPCLVWWTGDNENATQGYFNKKTYTGKIAATQAIAPVLERLDPRRTFLLSSPYGGVPFQSAACGTTHNTAYLGAFFDFATGERAGDYHRELQRYLSRFMAEQPSFGMPFASSLKKFLTRDDIFGEEFAAAEYHCQNNPCLEKTIFTYACLMAERFFGAFRDGEDRLYKLQLLQCEWLRISFELYRRSQWFSAGILYWMFNDCWPTSVSWSIIDYYGDPKPAFYVFKRCAKPVITSFFEEDGCVRLHVCVNGADDAAVRGRVYRYDVLTGEERTVAEFDGVYPVGSTKAVEVRRDAVPDIDAPASVLLCDIHSDRGDDRSVYFPNTYKKVPWDTDRRFELKKTADGYAVTGAVSIPYVMLDTGKRLSDNCFFLKKGETVTVTVQ